MNLLQSYRPRKLVFRHSKMHSWTKLKKLELLNQIVLDRKGKNNQAMNGRLTDRKLRYAAYLSKLPQ